MKTCYDLWLNQVCESENTKKRHLQDVNRFDKWARINHQFNIKTIPSKWREAKYSGKPAEKDKFLDELKDLISDYFVYLKKYPYTPLSVNRSMSVIMSFLHYYDIPFKPIRIRHPYVRYHNRDITKEEVKKILNYSNVRNRAIYLVLYETGMRPWTAVNLKWKHIKEDFIPQRIPMKIKLTSDILKCRVSERFVFIGENGFDALFRYLKRRKFPLKDDDYVFVTEKPFGKRIGTHAISQAFNAMVQKLNLAEKRGRMPKELRLYSLRKAFSKFMAVNVDRTFVEYWLGHTSTATHYVSEDVEYHRKMYAKGYSALQLEPAKIPASITEELRKKDAEEMEELRTQLATVIHKLTEKDKEIQELKRLVLPLTELMKMTEKYGIVDLVVKKRTQEQLEAEREMYSELGEGDEKISKAKKPRE